MQIVSFEFLTLVFLTMICHQILPVKWKHFSILGASIIFYLSYGKEHIIFFIVASLITFYSAKYMNKIYDEFNERVTIEGWNRKEKLSKMGEYKKKNKYILIPTVVILLVYFIACKYVNRIFDLFSNLNSQEKSLVDLLVPLGISYYTFSMIGYLLDVYWRKTEAEKSFIKFFTVTIYFPHIIQGPFSRYQKLLKQINNAERWVKEKDVFYGMQLMLYGYFKKMVIADRLAIFTSEVFTKIDNYYGIIIWVAMIFSVIQIYCDFSGYMDIVSGVSQMFGIRLEENFKRPFFSRSVAEFWRRWHITLGGWFKDYLLMPISASKGVLRISDWVRKRLGNNAAKNIAILIPLGVVWLATGLWHGNDITYLIWGMYYAILIGGATVCAPVINKITQILRINTETIGWHFIQSLRTFIIFGFGRIITVPGTLAGTQITIQHMFKELRLWEIMPKGVLFRCGISKEEFFVIVCAVVVVVIVSILQERGFSIRDEIAKQNIFLRWIIYYIAFFSIIILGVYGPGYSAQNFMYAIF